MSAFWIQVDVGALGHIVFIDNIVKLAIRKHILTISDACVCVCVAGWSYVCHSGASAKVHMPAFPPKHHSENHITLENCCWPNTELNQRSCMNELKLHVNHL